MTIDKRRGCVLIRETNSFTSNKNNVNDSVKHFSHQKKKPFQSIRNVLSTALSSHYGPPQPNYIVIMLQ